MFTPLARENLRDFLLRRAATDPRLNGVAITGSAAASRLDPWSDIDLAFGVEPSSELPAALAEWTAHMYSAHDAVHHVDVLAGQWTYRVFLLANSLQVDLAFVPQQEFRALSPEFRLVSGEAQEDRHLPQPSAAYLIGFGWLYALHARSSIARGKHWQAEYMISGMRDTALSLACLRHNAPAVLGRGLHLLPPEVADPFAESLVRSTDTLELQRAFRATLRLLGAEIDKAGTDVAQRLRPVLDLLANA